MGQPDQRKPFQTPLYDNAETEVRLRELKVGCKKKREGKRKGKDWSGRERSCSKYKKEKNKRKRMGLGSYLGGGRGVKRGYADGAMRGEGRGRVPFINRGKRKKGLVISGVPKAVLLLEP